MVVLWLACLPQEVKVYGSNPSSIPTTSRKRPKQNGLIQNILNNNIELNGLLHLFVSKLLQYGCENVTVTARN